ncbi:hypothetical protein BJ508DRAFT_308723 [Ascobolus immersus RN42]|uniref:Uncharacterized protein n=1 Tax=Ascobolus immersus RN42 TaxID=1160509 RepID=A0A3N4I481_ASCIM|nr:hypothetical protein BJ508DRAFT_308723 [Ascobolus immersus RN42]
MSSQDGLMFFLSSFSVFESPSASHPEHHTTSTRLVKFPIRLLAYYSSADYSNDLPFEASRPSYQLCNSQDLRYRVTSPTAVFKMRLLTNGASSYGTAIASLMAFGLTHFGLSAPAPQGPVATEKGFTSTNSYCSCPYTLKKGENCALKVTQMEERLHYPIPMHAQLWDQNNLLDGKELCDTAKEGDEICYQRVFLPKDGKKELLCETHYWQGPNKEDNPKLKFEKNYSW